MTYWYFIAAVSFPAGVLEAHRALHKLLVEFNPKRLFWNFLGGVVIKNSL